MTLSLAHVLARLDDHAFTPSSVCDANFAIARFTADSRDVATGDVFVALPGTRHDGQAFIADAIARGAALIVATTPRPDGQSIAWLRVADVFLAYATIAAAFHGDPARDIRVLATTGTNGKTTTSFLLQAIMNRAGHRCGLLSTVRVDTGREVLPTIFTTPPAADFHRYLAVMRNAGCDFAAVEASSHGLDQKRIAALDVAVAGYTNLSRDHLDYHGTMERYADAKALLFRNLAARAAICIDDATGQRFAAIARDRGLPLVTLSTTIPAHPEAHLRVLAASFDLKGSSGTVALPDGTTRAFSTRLVGAHNLQNAMVALAMAHLAGLAWDDALALLAEADGAPGRLEPVATGAIEPTVLVDYAHTPDALAQVLATVRAAMAHDATRTGRLLCVFGAGGDRDRGKRPEMAAAVAAHADIVIATSDNPRTENPVAILDDVVAGLPPGHPHIRETDRRTAIQRAIELAGPADVVVIAGKGHEDYQIIGTEKIFFDDRVAAREALTSRQQRAADSHPEVTP